MSAPGNPLDPTGDSPTDPGAPTSPATGDANDVQGYYLFICSACSHQHGQTDPKCNVRCAHGAAIYTKSPPSTFNIY